MSGVLSILVLTEDSSPCAFPAVMTLVKKMFRQVDEHVQTHDRKIRFRPIEGDEAALRAVRANCWKSAALEDDHAIRSLARHIATQLQQARGFVLFHYDGDRPWAARASSENVDKFRRFRNRVLQVIMGTNARRDGATVDPFAAASALEKLIELVPFYSIEAWLFQNAVLARQLCNNSCANPRHGELIARWEGDRGALDEEDAPKDMLCIGGKHNDQLAGSPHLPVDEIMWAQKSFHEAVVRLRACTPLLACLAETYG